MKIFGGLKVKMNFFKYLRNAITKKIITAFFFILILISTYGIQLQMDTWNLHNFGYLTKTENRIEEIRRLILDQCPDVLFLQEIQANGQSFDALGKELERHGYGYARTEQFKPKASNDEGYGILYKKSRIQVKEVKDHLIKGTNEVQPIINEGTNGKKMVRPPMRADLIIDGNFEMTVYNAHVRPENRKEKGKNKYKEVERELGVLQDAVNSVHDVEKDNVCVIGDFNAGGQYFKGGFSAAAHSNLFPNSQWQKLIPDNVNTSVKKPPLRKKSTIWNPYDRIIFSKHMADQHKNCAYQIIDVLGTVSDHKYIQGTIRD